jgi:hypothetical protein
VISIKKNKSKRKILRPIHSYDEEFIVEWSETLRKGIWRHVLKTTIVTTVVMWIIGICFLLSKRSMYGYEQNQTMLVALSQGLILGVILSLMQWGLSNDRYNRLKQRK